MIRLSSLRAKEDEEASRPLEWSMLVPGMLLLLAMWLVFWLDVNTSFRYYRLGIFPRSFFGLLGLIFHPLIHGDFNHLLNNSIPILILMSGLYYFYPERASRVVLYAWLGNGLLVWIFARESFHIGASGLIYALVAYLFFSGILSRKPRLMAFSLIVVFLYGSLIWGIFPLDEKISHEAHLSGAVVGTLLGIAHNFNSSGVAKDEHYASLDDVPKNHSGFYSEQKVQYHYKAKDKTE